MKNKILLASAIIGVVVFFRHTEKVILKQVKRKLLRFMNVPGSQLLPIFVSTIC